MVQAPATYHLEGRTIHFDEGAEVLFPQHMAHEVWSRGIQRIRRSTTHRLWVSTANVAAAVPQEIAYSTAKVQQEANQSGGWKFWRLAHRDWVAIRQNKQTQKQKDHFTLATTEIAAEEVREGRTIWQCGPKFHFNSPIVSRGAPPPPKLRESINDVVAGMPFKDVCWVQAIFNQYVRQQTEERANREPIWEGFKGARHPWIQVNIPRPSKEGRKQQGQRKWVLSPSSSQEQKPQEEPRETTRRFEENTTNGTGQEQSRESLEQQAKGNQPRNNAATQTEDNVVQRVQNRLETEHWRGQAGKTTRGLKQGQGQCPQRRRWVPTQRTTQDDVQNPQGGEKHNQNGTRKVDNTKGAI
jgi:hypothetical protein